MRQLSLSAVGRVRTPIFGPSLGCVATPRPPGCYRTRPQALRCAKAFIRLADIAGESVVDLGHALFNRLGGIGRHPLDGRQSLQERLEEVPIGHGPIVDQLFELADRTARSTETIGNSDQDRPRPFVDRVELLGLDAGRAEKLAELRQRTLRLRGRLALNLQSRADAIGELQQIGLRRYQAHRRIAPPCRTDRPWHQSALHCAGPSCKSGRGPRPD